MGRASVVIASTCALLYAATGLAGAAMAAVGSQHEAGLFAVGAILAMFFGWGVVPAILAVVIAIKWSRDRAAKVWVGLAFAWGLAATLAMANFLPLLLVAALSLALLAVAAILQARSKAAPPLATRATPGKRPQH